ncbi:larval cuticle protein LCP-17-like [Plodia interpunctella]|uniref:larval cuticle protein LCP-17-like n=1 Tax=Plodia interpunctella TaxID=58824 RepID=UPI0023675537|nr:larval cuticle protein LCP-17-like [Plodia interpunctella]
MKFLIVACLIVSAYAATDDVSAPIVKSDFNSSPDGGFQFAYETGNGISAHAEGHLKSVGSDEVLEIQGSSQYQSPEGEIIQLSYVANELGYQPQGAHLPTPPPTEPIPDYILRSLEWIAAHPYQEKKV